jgi:hypothetical protein
LVLKLEASSLCWHLAGCRVGESLYNVYSVDLQDDW